MPIRRYIFNTLTVVSLLLMLATVGLWVDSCRYAVGFVCTLWSPSLELSARSGPSGFDFSGVVLKPARSAPWTWSSYRWEVQGAGFLDGRRWLAFGTYSYAYTPKNITVVSRGLALPHWFLVLIFAVLPTIWFIKWRKRRKLAMVGSCPSCGYDLTGNETGICPECGVGKVKDLE